MHNKTFTAEIAHGVSSRHRIDIIKRFVSAFIKSVQRFELLLTLCRPRAKVLNVKVTNAAAKLRSEE